MCKYYVVISDIMVGFFLDVFFLLLAVILSELYGKLRRNKYWVTGKSAQKSLCEGHHLFDGTLSFLCHILLLSSSTPLPKWRICWMVPIKIQNIATGGILCDVENNEIRLQFDISWLASVRTWYYLRLFLASVVLAMILH